MPSLNDLWFSSTDPQRMIAILRGRASDRKLRLFALTCIRPYRGLLDQESSDAFSVAERLADGLASSEERKRARELMLPEVRRLDTYAADRRALAKAAVCWSLARRPYR